MAPSVGNLVPGAVKQGVGSVTSTVKGVASHTLDPSLPPPNNPLAGAKSALDGLGVPTFGVGDQKELVEKGAVPLVSDVDCASAPVPDDGLKTELETQVEDASGAFPEGETGAVAREIPDWFRIGWQDQVNSTHLFSATADDQKPANLLTQFVNDTYYGSWFHNAGIIIFAVVSTHYVTRFGGGWSMLLVIMACCATYYETSIKRTRRNMRDDLAIQSALKGLKNDVESTTWLNHFLSRFWLIYEPVLTAAIVAVVDGVMAANTPGFLDSIRMTTFTLGNKAPRIEFVKTYPGTDEDVVLMDWRFSFIPNDVADMLVCQAEKKVNSKIIVQIKFGVGPALLTKEISVEDISFQGTMRLKLKLQNPFPHIETVEFCFLQPPDLDFSLNPMGFDLSMVPGPLFSTIISQIHATLEPMMYSPNVYTLDLSAMLSGAPADAAVGVLAVTIYYGRGFKANKLGGGTPDPYVTMSIAGREELARTEIKANTMNPNWNETKFLLLQNLADPLVLTVYDFNDHRKDDVLGSLTFDTKLLEDDLSQEGCQGEITTDGKTRGSLKYDAVFFPVLKPVKLADGTEEPVPESCAGVLRITVHQAKDIGSGNTINPYFRLLFNGREIRRSLTYKRAASPAWELGTEVFLQDKSKPGAFVVEVLDEGLTGGSLGYVKLRTNQLLDPELEDWKSLNNSKTGGRVRVTATWNPVAMTGSINGAGAYTPPIGVLRLLIKNAKDLKNVEGLGGGKSDPYLRVMSHGIVVSRTLIKENNLNPEWNQYLYVTVRNPKDRFTLEAMDYENSGKDRTLGMFEFPVKSLIAEGPDKKAEPWISTGRVSQTGTLSTGKKIKGTVFFDAEFIPCMHLNKVSFDPPEESAGVISDAKASEPTSVSLTKSPEPKDATIPVPSSPEHTNGTPNGETENEKVQDEDEGLDISREDLLKTQSGILAFQIISGKLAKRGSRVEVLFDDGYWPAYSSEPARSTTATFDEIGEAFIREMEYSQVILKLNSADKDSQERVEGSTTIDLLSFLDSCLDKPHEFTLHDGKGNKSLVTIMCKYIPVSITIDPRESVTNSGSLRFEIKEGRELPAADRSGKSDPYVVLHLNDEQVYKSQVIRKTLAPKWNESVDLTLYSRLDDVLLLEVFDWDRVGSATLLGRTLVNLSSLPLIERSEQVLPLSGGKIPGKSGGEILIAMVFTPAFISRARQGTASFGPAGRVVSTVGGGVGRVASTLGGGVGAVGGTVVGGVAGGVSAVGGTVGKKLFGKRTSVINPLPTPPATTPPGSTIKGFGDGVPPVPPIPYHVLDGSAPPINVQAPDTGPGNLSVTINSLSGTSNPDDKKFVTVTINGGKSYDTSSSRGDPAEYGQTFKSKTTGGPCLIDFAVVQKKTMGSNIPLGRGEVNLWDHISVSTAPTTTINVPVGEGMLSVTLSWTASSSHTFEVSDDHASSYAHSISPSQKTKKFGSSRFSLLHK